MSDIVLNTIALLAFTIMVGYASSFLARKTKIPDVITLLLFGILMGYIGFVDVNLFKSAAPILSPLTLIVIILDSGLNMDIKTVIRSFPRAVLLGIFGVIFSMVAAAFIGVFIIGLDLKISLLMGAIFGGTSAETVLALLHRAEVRNDVKSILSLESVLNDTFCILAAVAVLGLIVPGIVVGVSPLSIAFTFGAGAAIGSVYGLVWLIALNRFRGAQFDFMLTIAVAMLVYVGSDYVFGMGAGAIAVLFFGLMLGNFRSFSKFTKRKYTLPPHIGAFHSGITFAMRSFFFVYMGLIATVQFEYMFFGAAFLSALMLARVAAVKLAMVRSKLGKSDLNLIKIMGPKGLVAAALVQLAVSYGIAKADVIQNLAFIIIFSSTVIASIGSVIITSRKEKHGAGKARHSKK